MKTYTTPGQEVKLPEVKPLTEQELSDLYAEKTSGTEVFQPSPKLPPNVLPK